MSITISDINDAMLNRQADRIRELESKLSSRDAEVASLTGQRDRQIDTCATRENEIIALEKERDKLSEQVKMLRDALNRIRTDDQQHMLIKHKALAPRSRKNES